MSEQEPKSPCAIDDGPSSPQIDQLAKALSAAQADMSVAEMDKRNPAFKSKYSSLGAMIAASKGALGKHGLSILQRQTWLGDKLSMRTLLLHASGQWLDCGILEATVKADRLTPVQAAGSLMTYLRRYSLQAVCKLYGDEDTDGNGHPGDSESSQVPSDAAAGALRSEYIPEQPVLQPELPDRLWNEHQNPSDKTRMWILNKLKAAPGQENWQPLSDYLRKSQVINDSQTPAEWPLDLLPQTRTAMESIRVGIAKKGEPQ